MGKPWKGVQVQLAELLPDVLGRREDFAYSIVPRAINELFGEGNWYTERRPAKSGSGYTTWINLTE